MMNAPKLKFIHSKNPAQGGAECSNKSAGGSWKKKGTNSDQNKKKHNNIEDKMDLEFKTFESFLCI